MREQQADEAEKKATAERKSKKPKPQGKGR
jgi:hypothetical protein